MKDTTTILASAARSARRNGMTADEALTIVAQVFGAVIGRHGTIDGFTVPEDERAVRKVRAKREPKQEGDDGDK